MNKYTPLVVSALSAAIVVLILVYSMNTVPVSVTGSFVAGFINEPQGNLLFIAALIGICISCMAVKCFFDANKD